jgi:hypothetical protein
MGRSGATLSFTANGCWPQQKAQVFWRNAVQDPQFARQIERLRVAYEPDFGIAAIVMLTNQRGHLTTFVLDLDSEDGEMFAMMAGMGFFLQSARLGE